MFRRFKRFSYSMLQLMAQVLAWNGLSCRSAPTSPLSALTDTRGTLRCSNQREPCNEFLWVPESNGISKHPQAIKSYQVSQRQVPTFCPGSQSQWVVAMTSNQAGGALPTPLVSMAEAFSTEKNELKWTHGSKWSKCRSFWPCGLRLGNILRSADS